MHGSEFRIELEESIKRPHQLIFDLLLGASLNHVHGNRCVLAVLQTNARIFERFHLIGGKKAESVNQGEFRHQMNISSSCVARETFGRIPWAYAETPALIPAITPETS